MALIRGPFRNAGPPSGDGAAMGRRRVGRLGRVFADLVAEVRPA
ncbi:hypothetical protein [Streptomyces sp. NBC_00893]|nr:hypothetical protein [Streptomyces sp. NBC_00893]MCX4847265.1 hypothetical protein [Streptomyces sp. NBC_00893]